MAGVDVHEAMRRHIHETVRREAMRVAEAREQACEAAIQSGTCGVLETHLADGSVTFDVVDSVPVGEIHVVTRRW